MKRIETIQLYLEKENNFALEYILHAIIGTKKTYREYI